MKPFGNHSFRALPGAVLSYADKKVPKEPARGGAEILLLQEQAPSPGPHPQRYDDRLVNVSVRYLMQ